MKAIADLYGEAAGARIALAAGADQVIVAVPDLEVTLSCRDEVLGTLRSGLLPEERVLEAAGRVRRLAERYATPVAAVAAWDPEAGLEAARRAVRGAVRGQAGAGQARGAHVVDLFPPPHPALNWGGEDLLSELRAVDPTATGTAVTGEAADPASLADGIARVSEGAPLIVATCDADLHPWQRHLQGALLTRRPDAVRVATGLPDGDALCSYGRGRANLRAMAEVLTGVGALGQLSRQGG
jgi:beta-N-acetylhexosaminidase